MYKFRRFHCPKESSHSKYGYLLIFKFYLFDLQLNRHGILFIHLLCMHEYYAQKMTKWGKIHTCIHLLSQISRMKWTKTSLYIPSVHYFIITHMCVNIVGAKSPITLHSLLLVLFVLYVGILVVDKHYTKLLILFKLKY